MIHKIWASDKRFKPVEFSAGLNVILAERAPESGQKDTRNGAGKTTLLNVIHFCLGADLISLNLPKDDLHNWIFFIRIELYGEIVTAKRSIENAKIIEVDTIIPGLPIISEGELFESSYSSSYKNSDGNRIKNDDWKKILGNYLFGITEESSAKYTPSFRSLVSYFARRGVDAYANPFHYFRNQTTCSMQINNAYLLGLNWLHASEAQEIREKNSAVQALSFEIKTGIVANQGELEAERVRMELELKQESDAIKSFHVHPQYRELQEQANQLTEEMHELSNESLLLRSTLDRYMKAVSEEKPPDLSSVDKIFSEVGIHFADNVKKSLADAKVFHKTIVQNRKRFLESEIVQLKNVLASNDENIKQKSNRRAELLRILQSHGALDEFSVLQERVVEKKEQLEIIKNKISNIQEMAQRKKEIKASKIELETKLQRDYEQNRPEWEKAITLFNENSQALYNEPGNLVINTTDNGYKFGVEIQKSSSAGVGKMKIFCYDIMLVELMKINQRGSIDFLFHDSSIFDGVDSRQIALALMHAHRKAAENNFQYICALNSDIIPNDDFDTEFRIDKHVRLTLKDQNPEDSILGFHFELTKKQNHP